MTYWRLCESNVAEVVELIMGLFLISYCYQMIPVKNTYIIIQCLVNFITKVDDWERRRRTPTNP